MSRTNPTTKPRKVDFDALKEVGKALLFAIGEDPDRPGLKDTPRRFAQAWREFMEYDPGKIDTTFDKITEDQLVVVGPMRMNSFCEHHLLPFWCDVTIGYVADHSVLGLSKFARIAHKHAHHLQLQERLVEQICREVMAVTNTDDVAVIGIGQHSCMSTRGIKTPGLMKSSVVRGRFKHDADTRAEFLRLAGF